MKLKKLNILLADPRHDTVGAHSMFVPINIGYIGSHILNQLKNDVHINLKLSTDPKEIFDELKKNKTDIIGLSNYIWNAELSNFITKKAKEINSNTLCVLGGPEFPAGTGALDIKNNNENNTYDKCFNYLLQRPTVDYFAYSDGEVAFLEIVKSFLKNECSTKKMRYQDECIKGCVNISSNKLKLIVGSYIPRIGMEGSVKVEGRDLIPSPYTNGLLDKFLNGKYVPAFETARGCPFSCTFCDQGMDKTKITAFSVKRLAEEIEYVGEKISKINDATQTISIFDSNWGIFQKDVELAKKMLNTMNKYNWPQYIECLTPKSNWKNILEINDILKNRVELTLSMQSTNSEVLTYIKRRNWTTDQYLNFIEEAKKRGKPQLTEMIIPLPGETEESYFEGVKFMMHNHVQTRTFGLMMLCGAELGRDAAIKKYGLIGKYRILPKQFGEYFGEKIIETEMICVSTNTMNFDEYLNCRNYSFIIKLLGHPLFYPLNLLLKRIGIEWYDFSIFLFKKLKENSLKGKFRDLFLEFNQKAINELFQSKEECINFYKNEENYKKMLDGNLAENLAAKYVVKGIINYNDILDTIFFVIKEISITRNISVNFNVLDSAQKWLKNLYLINEILNEKKLIQENNYNIVLNFDFPNWLKNNSESIENFEYKVKYNLDFEKRKIINIKKEINSIFGGDKVSAFERFLERRHMVGFNFLEKKYKQVQI